MESFHAGFPIRISPDLGLFAPPRSFSQLAASFFGSQCQGIHPALLMLDLFGPLLWLSVASQFFVFTDSKDSF